MNYEKNYYDYMSYVKSQVKLGLRPSTKQEMYNKRRKEEYCYYEFHHIKLKSLGGDDSKENVIPLSAREHYLAHYLLWKFNPCKQTTLAFKWLNEYNNETKKEYIRNSKIYEKIKIEYSKYLSLKFKNISYEERYGNKYKQVIEHQKEGQKRYYKNNPDAGKRQNDWCRGKNIIEMYGKEKAEKIREKLINSHLGKVQSDETKKKRSESIKKAYNNPLIKHKFLEIMRSKEVRQKISNSHKGQIAWNKGLSMKEEQKQKLREANLGKKWCNNGIQQRQCLESDIPDGWTTGRLKRIK